MLLFGVGLEMWKLLQDSSKEDKEALLFSFAVKKNCHGGTQTRRREKAFPLCLRDSVAKTFMTEGDKPSSWTFMLFVHFVVQGFLLLRAAGSAATRTTAGDLGCQEHLRLQLAQQY